MRFDCKCGRHTKCVDHRYAKCETGSTTKTCWHGPLRGSWELREPLICSGKPSMLSLSPTNVILIITKRVFFGTDSGGPLAYEGTKSRLGAGGGEARS